MKYLRAVKQILIGMGVMLAWAMLPAVSSHAYEGVRLDDCRILDKYDGNDGRRSITLRTALHYANKQNREDQRCRKSILIEAEEVNLMAPLVIEILNVADNTDRYIYPIEGRRNGQEGETVKISFAGLRNYTGDERHCAIIFRGGTHDIRLKNIVIENVPLDYNAVCIENSADYIVFDGVRIAHVENGHGFVIEDGSNDNLIMGNSELVNIDGDGIHIKNTDILAHNFLSATTRPLANEDRPTGPNGTAVFGREGGEDFVMKSVHGKFVHSDAPAKILLSEINTAGTDGVFRISGAVVNGSATCVPGIAPEAAGADFLSQVEQGVERIQVYAVAATETGGQGEQGDGGPSKNAVFLTYVTKQADCAGSSCANGIGGASNPIGAQGNFGGIFHFVLDTNEFLDRINQNRVNGEQVVTSIDKIILVPEISGTIASATTPRRLIGGPSETDLCEGAQTGGGGGGAGGNVDPGSGFINFALGGWSLRSQCQASAPTGGHPQTSIWDSDADGIPDYLEDLNHDCACDPDEPSCWDKPDSDSDGLADLAELRGAINERRWDDVGRSFLRDEPFCVADSIEPDPCNADESLEELEPDEPRLSDAQDDNSDNDSCRLLDGQEDRARIFSDRAKAHYYIWGGIGNITPLTTPDGVHLECTSFLQETGQDRIGAYYGVFVVKQDYSAVVRPYDYIQLPRKDEGVMPLACINGSVRRPTNFNGTWNESEGETKVDRAQTYAGTDDCECRGGQMQLKLGQNVCVYNCVDYEIFKGLPAQFVNNEASPTALLTDASGVPLLYNDLDAITQCSDIDRDGIPDCVENITGQCNFTDRGHNLDPYTRDTDQDDKVDGRSLLPDDPAPDDCPFAICTDPRAIYQHRPVLAHFLDRDRDGLTDAEEDLDLDGIVTKLGGKAGRETTETDPLAADTDEDKIGDFVEIQSWNRYTNAADPDTDGDTLPDGLEVVDYPLLSTGLLIDDVATPDRLYPDQSGQGCGRFEPVDALDDVVALMQSSVTERNRLGTDPASEDTDGDGIWDGIEVRCEHQTVNPPSGNLLAAGITEIDICSSPLADDSDGDGWSDPREYARASASDDSLAADGLMQYFETSPCDRDTDNDEQPDQTDRCPTSNNPQCTSVGQYGPDSDGDGLSDAIELILANGNRDLDSDGDGQPNINDADSDNDGLVDGQEDVTEPFGEIQTHLGDTNPLNPDTDGDGLRDGIERQYATKPNDEDSDDDCIHDGVEVNFQETSSFTGPDTDPTNPDTDGDGLCDGNNPSTNGGLTGDVNCIPGEDNGGAPGSGAVACDGVVNRDAEGRFLETDPRLADTDQDGILDYTEICSGGNCNFSANIGNATRGAPGGCFSLAPSAPLDASSMLYVYGLILMLNRVIRKKFQRKQ